MAPTPAPAPLQYTYTYTGLVGTYTYTYSYPDYSYSDYDGYTYSYPTYRSGDYPYNSDVAQTVVAVWAIAVGVIFGLQVLGLIIVAIVYFQRQKKRKVWYGRMAEHYRNGGLPPWAAPGVGGVGDGSVKAPLLSNDYNANSGVTYPLTTPQNSDPRAQYGNPSQFGVYGNLPPSNTQSTGPYSNASGVTGYTAASYHTANTIPSSPPPQSFSPQPRHSQYSTVTGSFEPHNAPPNVYNASPYPPPAALPSQFGPPSSPAPGTPAPYGDAPAYDAPPNVPQYAAASGSAQAPAYSGGHYNATEYPKEKGWEYTAPPAESPAKQ